MALGSVMERGTLRDRVVRLLERRQPAPEECTYRRVRPSRLDERRYLQIRNNVTRFLQENCACMDESGRLVLDVAPQDHEGAASVLYNAAVESIDIDAGAGTTYTGDITQYNRSLEDCRYDMVVCAEVLEHTRDPFGAVHELYRLLKPGGILLVTVPFDFRIHGPLPDYWRFTEYGLRRLLEGFEILGLWRLPSRHRPLMPVHYAAKARRPVR